MNRIEWLRQLSAFGAVGVVATLVHYFAALVAMEMFAVVVYLANVIGFCSALCVSLFGHSALTFKKRLSVAIARRFILVAVSAFLVSEGMLAVLTELGWHHRHALAVVVVAIPCMSFVINKFWVYAQN